MTMQKNSMENTADAEYDDDDAEITFDEVEDTEE